MYVVLFFLAMSVISGFVVYKACGWRLPIGIVYFFLSDVFLCILFRMATHKSTVGYAGKQFLTEMRVSHIVKYVGISAVLLVAVCILAEKRRKGSDSEINNAPNSEGERGLSIWLFFKEYRKEYIVFLIIMFVVFILFNLHGWAVSNFQMERPDAVIATLSIPHSHIDGRIYTSLILEVILFTFLSTVIMGIVIAPFVHLAKKRFVKPAVSILLMAGCIVYVLSDIPVAEYIEAFANGTGEPVSSEFYKKYYVNPKDVKIEFPQKKKNLIVVFLESYESTLSDQAAGGMCEKNHIPNLTDICKNEISFGTDKSVGGGHNIKGTGWTIAGILAKLNGIVYSPVIYNQESGVIGEFLPYNTGLTDILSNEGYNMVFSCGSDGEFANRDSVFCKHFLQKIAKQKCRSLQNGFVGCCTYIL